MPNTKKLWIRYSEANSTTPVVLEEDGYITSLQYSDQPSGKEISVLSLQFNDDEGVLQTFELGRLAPGRTEQIRFKHIIRAEGSYSVINDGPNPVSVSGFHYDTDVDTVLATATTAGDSAPEKTNITTMPAADGGNGVGDHVQRKPAPVRPAAAAGARANPPRQARRTSIIINDEEDGRGRKAPTRKVANDSDKATRKRKAADTTSETNSISSAVAKPSQKQKKRKNEEEPHPLRSQGAKRRQTKAAGAPDLERVDTATSLQSDGSVLLADSSTPRPESIANTGGLNVPESEDRVKGTGAPITIGSKVDVYYVLKVWQGGSFRKFASLTFEKPPLRITIGDHFALYGLSGHLDGMAKGGERLIFVPPTHVPNAAFLSGIAKDTTLRIKVKLWNVRELAVSPAPGNSRVAKSDLSLNVVSPKEIATSATQPANLQPPLDGTPKKNIPITDSQPVNIEPSLPQTARKEPANGGAEAGVSLIEATESDPSL
ncbi:peptidylprolyl isomerase fpr3 [Pleurotus ostreatus]|uniref:Uncharacterized protein n=1 Tax=Pleurotus cornucopiae TaxID=5321 RepID=A0ACB7IVR8_PLECO|nr:hypothetical protein CCMSSC00406_0006676 [Pleurotus cornucopiae]KAJ8692061.1 peptidylprolyl isomerase fpr3 [Pleurotus ostreatus]